jgi:hypothetical protein
MRGEFPIMECSTLPLEIASNHLTSCYYVALCCPQHGEIRAAMREAPVDRFHPCPVCGLRVHTPGSRRDSKICSVLGRGPLISVAQ